MHNFREQNVIDSCKIMEYLKDPNLKDGLLSKEDKKAIDDFTISVAEGPLETCFANYLINA